MIYDYIIDGNIKSTLEEACYIFHTKNKFDELLKSLILVCNYIGINMNINIAYKWHDIVNLTNNFLTQEKIIIDDTLILLTKMCILCKNIQEHKPISIHQLRKRLIPFFENPLSSLDFHMFQQILPPITSESFNIASKISNCFKNLFNEINSSNKDNLPYVINNIRLCIEFVCRRNIWIETQLNKDHDCIWFLWGILKILTNDSTLINDTFNLFIYDWKKSVKKNRIGMLYGSVYLAIFYYKKELIQNWKNDEDKIFNHIKSISHNMMETTRTNFPIEKKHIHVISTYIPNIKNIPFVVNANKNVEDNKEIYF